jgi:hypothetical protein
MTDAEIRQGLALDPEVHPTDAEFWKNAKIVRPKS